MRINLETIFQANHAAAYMDVCKAVNVDLSATVSKEQREAIDVSLELLVSLFDPHTVLGLLRRSGQFPRLDDVTDAIIKAHLSEVLIKELKKIPGNLSPHGRAS